MHGPHQISGGKGVVNYNAVCYLYGQSGKFGNVVVYEKQQTFQVMAMVNLRGKCL